MEIKQYSLGKNLYKKEKVKSLKDDIKKKEKVQ